MLGLSPWFSVAAVLAAAVLAWCIGRFASVEAATSTPFRAVLRALEHRFAPIVAGVVTTAVTWTAWGGLNRHPIIHDEAAYHLQAKLFASGVWAGVSPPLPEFFEQLYVFVVPVLASKYPPGHSLMLAPGALVDLPGLPVVILNGIAGALIFALARRVAGSLVALLTLLLWLTCFPAIYYRASYFSEVTSGTAWLAAWWFLLLWHQETKRGGSELQDEAGGQARRRRRWLIALAACVGVVAITRPLTAVALALPIAVVVVRETHRRRTWRDFGMAVAVGAACVAVIPLWSLRTTGFAFLTPHKLYVQFYEPHNVLGFGVDTTARALRGVSRDMAMANWDFFDEHRRHTISALPRTLAQRMERIAIDLFYDWRLGLAPFALLGLAGLPATAWFAMATLGTHLGAYLLYAHPPHWSLYYLESEPLLAFVTAYGIMRVIVWGARRRGMPSAAKAPSSGMTVAVLALAVLAFVPGTLTLGLLRRALDRSHSYFERFETLVRAIPDERAIVFVRYMPDHNYHFSLVRNPPSHETARAWIVHDRGADNARLLSVAPERRPYLFDERTWTLRPFTPANLTPPPASER